MTVWSYVVSDNIHAVEIGDVEIRFEKILFFLSF